MSKELITEYGKITISRDVIGSLVGIATTACFGVVGVVNSKWTNGINELLGRESLSKGVDITFEGDALMIRVNVVISYGNRITAIADNIVDNIKYNVEKYTGLAVDKIEVNVQGIRFLS